MKIFLGGTCADSTWREALIPMLNIDYYNPVVKDWTAECQAEEIKQREECDFVLYTITPSMIGVYSIAEVIDDSNKRPEKTIFCLLGTCGDKAFLHSQWMSLLAVSNMVVENGGYSFLSLESVASFVNYGFRFTKSEIK